MHVIATTDVRGSGVRSLGISVVPSTVSALRGSSTRRGAVRSVVLDLA